MPVQNKSSNSKWRLHDSGVSKGHDSWFTYKSKNVYGWGRMLLQAFFWSDDAQSFAIVGDQGYH